MTTQRNGIFIVMMVLVIGTVSVFPGDPWATDDERGFIFQVGLGFAGLSYGEESDTLLSGVEELPEGFRMQLYLNLGAGLRSEQVFHRN